MAKPNIEELFKAMRDFMVAVNRSRSSVQFGQAKLALKQALTELGIADNFDWEDIGECQTLGTSVPRLG